MAEVSRLVAAGPEEVFAVLADGWTYSNWVTGTSHIRAVDRDWPAPGTRIHHAAGIWPVVTRDETVVEGVVPAYRLDLTARGRPLGEARVTILLRPYGPHTRVEMIETPSAGPGRWIHNPLAEALLARRNTETLARLAATVERRTQPDH
jgi:hypothetical protein